MTVVLTRNRQGKSQQPRPAAGPKRNNVGFRGRRNFQRKGRMNRRGEKSTEELDAEMTDYFANGNAGATDGAAQAQAQAAQTTQVNGGGQPAVNGQQPITNGGDQDTGMEEISVSFDDILVGIVMNTNRMLVNEVIFFFFFFYTLIMIAGTCGVGEMEDDIVIEMASFVILHFNRINGIMESDSWLQQ